jgi:hypothetical protein
MSELLAMLTVKTTTRWRELGKGPGSIRKKTAASVNHLWSTVKVAGIDETVQPHVSPCGGGGTRVMVEVTRLVKVGTAVISELSQPP